MFTTTKEKLEEAARLGVKGVMENDKEAMKVLKSSFDFMLSTIPEKHDLNPFIPLVKRNGTLTVVGALEPLVGNLADTQEVLEFCAEHGIGPTSS